MHLLLLASESAAQKNELSAKEEEAAKVKIQLDKTESAVRNVRYPYLCILFTLSWIIAFSACSNRLVLVSLLTRSFFFFCELIAWVPVCAVANVAGAQPRGAANAKSGNLRRAVPLQAVGAAGGDTERERRH